MRRGRGDKNAQVMLESVISLICILAFLAGMAKFISWVCHDMERETKVVSDGGSYTPFPKNFTVPLW